VNCGSPIPPPELPVELELELELVGELKEDATTAKLELEIAADELNDGAPIELDDCELTDELEDGEPGVELENWATPVDEGTTNERGIPGFAITRYKFCTLHC
jgi:hypothetical protein